MIAPYTIDHLFKYIAKYRSLDPAFTIQLTERGEYCNAEHLRLANVDDESDQNSKEKRNLFSLSHTHTNDNTKGKMVSK